MLSAQVLRSLIHLNKARLAASDVWQVIDESLPPDSSRKTVKRSGAAVEADEADESGSTEAASGPGMRIANVEGSIQFHGVEFEYPSRKGIRVSRQRGDCFLVQCRGIRLFILLATFFHVLHN